MPRVQNPGLGAGQNAMLVSTVTLSAALLQSSIGFDVIIVAAPGAGKIIVPIIVALSYAFGTHPYQSVSSPADQMLVNYGTDVNIVMEQPPMAGLLTALQSQFSVAGPAFPNGVIQVPNSVNKAMLIHALPYNVGPLLTASVSTGGTGYVVNDTGSINDGITNPLYKVTSIGAGGAVTGFTLTSPGSGCTVQSGTTTTTGGAQPGVGINFTVNELTIQLGDGTLKVTTYYQIIAVP